MAKRHNPAATPVELAAGGEMGALIRAYDWSGTTLGQPSDWPQALLSALSIMLHSRSQCMFIAWGPEQIFFCNDACRSTFNLDGPRVLARPLTEVWSDIWSELSPAVAAALSGEPLWFKDRKLAIQRDGQPTDIWCSCAGCVIPDQTGAFAGVICTVFDTTDAVLGVRELTAELEYRRELFELTPFFIAVLSGPKHVHTLANRAYAQLIGRQDVIGKSLYEVIPAFNAQYRGVLEEAYRSGTPFAGRELRYLLQESAGDNSREERFLDVICHPIRDGNGVVTSLLVEGFDVTERIKAEKALRHHADELQSQVVARTYDLHQTEEALRQSQKMEALGQLTGSIAHDFNNLLLGINGALGLAERRLQEGRHDEIARFIALAMQSSNRAAGLIHRMLAFARRQSLSPKPVRVGLLIESMMDLLHRSIGEATKLELALQEGDWLAHCDANQLESAILNLVINARDAMPNGGKLTIATYGIQVKKTEPDNQQGAKPGDYVCIVVSDSGSGMEPDVLSHIFEPFFTTKPVGRGTGLGLPMIYGFAKQSHGYVEVESRVSHGTTFRLCLPRSRERPAEEAAPGETRDMPRTERGEEVLVVEDDETVRQLVVEVLHDLGYRTREAADGLAGLAILQSPAKLDLLISDIGLPGLNGRQMVDAAASHRRDLPVLYMTAYAEPKPGSQDSYAPGMEVIAKPFTMDALAARVRKVMENK